MAKKTNSKTHRPPGKGTKSNPLSVPRGLAGAEETARNAAIIKVPSNYANAGDPVNVGRVSVISDEQKTTVGMTGESLQLGITSELVDLGLTAPVDLGDRVIDTALSEYMRSREITFSGRAFMPGAILYPFFDGKNVSAFCKPDGETAKYGDPLVCNSKGAINGTFKIPNNPETNDRFKTGTKAFRLTTSPTNQLNPPPASFAEARYHAVGWVSTKQKTTYSTRAYTYNINSVSQKVGDIATSGDQLEWASPCPRDPISESFFVYDEGGCYITAIDIFFYKKPNDPNKPQPPIILQLRDLAPGGNPATTVLPLGEVVKDADEIVINHFDGQKLTVTGNSNGTEGVTKGPWGPNTEVKASSNKIIEDGISFTSANPADDMIPTRFTFKAPIYVAQNTSYCFVLLSDSDEYNVWIAQSGPDITGRDGVDAFRNVGETNTEIGTDTPIKKDPYIQGVYFKSQNGISWTPDQTIDIKFKIWKAKFKTERTGEVDFVNESVPMDKLPSDPFSVGVGSSRIRVLHPAHGHTIGSKVFFEGVDAALLNNVLNRLEGHWIVKVEMDSYLIDIAASPNQPYLSAIANLNTNVTLPTESGTFGGRNVYASKNVRFDELMLLTTPLELPGTSIKWNIQTTTSQGVNDSENVAYEIMPRVNMKPNSWLVFDRPMHISSEINERNNTDTIKGPSQADDSSNPGAQKSLQIRAILASTNPNLSPVLDDSRFSVACSTNRIDNPAGYIPVGSLVSNNNVINDVYDNYQCLPPTQVPLIANVGGVSGLNNKLYFSSSTGVLSGKLTSSGTTVTGNNDTKFLTELSPGDVIKDSASGEERFVVSISTNKLMTISYPFNVNLSNSTVYGEPPPVRIKTFDDVVAKHLSKLDIGKLVTITNASSGRNVENVYVLEVNYTPDNTNDDEEMGAGKPCLCEIVLDYRTTTAPGFQACTVSAPVTIVQKDRYVDEIAPRGGSCTAKYISKALTLANPSNTLKVMFDAYRHSSNQIDLYYRVKEVDDPTPLKDTNWTLAEYNLDKNGELVTTVPSPNDKPESFSSYESNIQHLPTFSAVQVKIVMRGGNPARIPRIKQLSVIALEE